MSLSGQLIDLYPDFLTMGSLFGNNYHRAITVPFSYLFAL